MKRKERRPIRAMTAVTLRLGALLLILWLACMGCLTLGTAQYVMHDVAETGAELADTAQSIGRLHDLYYEEWGAETRQKYPGILDYRMLDTISFADVTISPPVVLDADIDFYRDILADCQTAALFTDAEGQVIHQSGDFLYFDYFTEEQWLAGDETADRFGWIDLGGKEDERYRFLRDCYEKYHWLMSSVSAMRITGYFEGSRMEPLALEVLTQDWLYDALDAMMEEQQTDSLSYTLSDLVADGRLEWVSLFDCTADAPADKELVTVYTSTPEMTVYEASESVTYHDQKYDDLLTVLELWDPSDDNSRLISEFHLTRTTVFDSCYYFDRSSYTADGPQEPELILRTAVTANPLLIAMSFLRNVYIITFLLALLGFLVLRRAVKKHLVTPLDEVNKRIADGWTNLDLYRDFPPIWREPRELVEHYQNTQDTLRYRQNELTRLNTALEYARTAEENRRQLVSHIAHEFKTPLAVIHSYAEGLNEHIAEDKREKYVDVILSETERLDGMVLELLDLSRLEAGKVRLARDEFDLVKLARSVFEHLELAAKAKALNVTLDFPETCPVTADEGRLRQVVENFAANAVKYTPAGGNIKACLSPTRSGVIFSVENDSPPLSGEALSKVWDTFYRADSARSGPGTGLGLAIAKNIVELHGGRCAARNTKTGVEFSFTL